MGILKRLKSLVKDNGINAEVFAGGSFAKGTFLKNDHDVDVFIKFNSMLKPFI